MPRLPQQDQQIVATHAAFINQVVEACHNSTALPALEPVLRTAAQSGWTQLVSTVRAILSGRRDAGLLQGLDAEDRAIVASILQGLQDPRSLPDPDAQADAALAAPGLAAMIGAAASGNPQALQIMSKMAEQMQRSGGDMARLAASLRPMINGERDPEKLSKGMSTRGEKLVLSILQELTRP